MVFPVVMYGYESWTINKAESQRIDAFELWCWGRCLKSPLDCKEIQPVNPKGNQSWIFIGRTDAETETPILWLPDAKNWFIWKDPDAGKDWRREEGSGWGTHVYLWQIHFDIWQNQYNIVKFKNKIKLKKKKKERNPRADLLQNGLVGSPCSPRDSQESSPTPQFKSINSSALSLLHSPTLTSIHDHWKNHSLD